MVTLSDKMFEGAAERVLVVGDGADGRALWASLRERHPQTTHCESYLGAIAELSKRSARTVLAVVSGNSTRLADAVAGLRIAAGDATDVFLCCTTVTEPLARLACPAGANDYLVLPLQAKDMDRALGRTAVEFAPRVDCGDTADLSALSAALEASAQNPTLMLRDFAELVRQRLAAKGASLVIDGSMTAVGAPVARPVLTTPLMRDGRVVGQVLVGERMDGPYDAADAERLRYLGNIIGHVISGVSRQRHWQRLAQTDEVSGLPNRRFLLEQLPAILARAKDERFPVTVLLFDVDDFKRYNDAHGHDAGDEIIRVVGQLFRQHCREQDIVVRYGGDEFAVAFWDAEGSRVAGSSHPGCALNVLDRFTAALRQHAFAKIDSEARLTVSGGLATYPWDGDNAESLISRADEALLAAKRAGKNKVLVMGAQPNG